MSLLGGNDAGQGAKRDPNPGKIGHVPGLEIDAAGMRVAPLVVESAPAPFFSRRAKSSSGASLTAIQAWWFTSTGMEREKCYR